MTEDKKLRKWHPSMSMLLKAGWDVEVVGGRVVVFGWRSEGPYSIRFDRRVTKTLYKSGKVYVSASGLDYDTRVECSHGLHMWREKNSKSMMSVAALVSETVFPSGWNIKQSGQYVIQAKCRSRHLFVGSDKKQLRSMVSAFLNLGNPISI